MKSVFPGHFRPSKEDYSKLWNESTFIIDANVLLNLYRYSSGTRSELEKALTNINDRVFITNQAAKEFLKNRLSVTTGQANEYTKASKDLDTLRNSFTNKNRHPFLPEEELKEFENLANKINKILETQGTQLLEKLNKDEILEFVDALFSGKTGLSYDENELKKIVKDGEDRYLNQVPPGYKDSNKDNNGDSTRKYGDLILWKQMIDFAIKHKTSVIFISDDKKEDWWLEQAGKTISPRPELIEEFYNKTDKKFWMYSVDQFMQQSANFSKVPISPDVLKEIIKVSAEQAADDVNLPSISLVQEAFYNSENDNYGFLTMTLNKPMKYATGTGKFSPELNNIPKLEVKLISSPNKDNADILIRSGCGTTKNFNIHIKSKKGMLEAGDYDFVYEAEREVS